VSATISMSVRPYRPRASFRPSGAEWHIQGVRAQMRQAFPVHLYRCRARIESLISAVKRQLSDRAPGRSLATQCLQALLLGIAYNIYRLWFFALLGIRRMSTKPILLKNTFCDETGNRPSDGWEGA
jgi:hypothetical protein